MSRAKRHPPQVILEVIKPLEEALRRPKAEKMKQNPTQNPEAVGIDSILRNVVSIPAKQEIFQSHLVSIPGF